MVDAKGRLFRMLTGELHEQTGADASGEVDDGLLVEAEDQAEVMATEVDGNTGTSTQCGNGLAKRPPTDLIDRGFDQCAGVAIDRLGGGAARKCWAGGAGIEEGAIGLAQGQASIIGIGDEVKSPEMDAHCAAGLVGILVIMSLTSQENVIVDGAASEREKHDAREDPHKPSVFVPASPQHGWRRLSTDVWVIKKKLLIIQIFLCIQNRAAMEEKCDNEAHSEPARPEVEKSLQRIYLVACWWRTQAKEWLI